MQLKKTGFMQDGTGFSFASAIKITTEKPFLCRLLAPAWH